MNAAIMSAFIAAQAATACTGDVIRGKPVISQLDVNDLEPGKKHRSRSGSAPGRR